MTTKRDEGTPEQTEAQKAEAKDLADRDARKQADRDKAAEAIAPTLHIPE